LPDRPGMLSLLELSIIFLALTLIMVIAVGIFLRRRFVAGRDRARNDSFTEKASSPAATEEE